MNKDTQISVGQMVAVLLISRLVVSMVFAPTAHQLSHGTDFLLSIVLHALLLLLLFLPSWWFGRRTGSGSTIDYAYILFGKGGTVLTALYALLCLFIQVSDLTRFHHFVSTTLSPDMSTAALCAALMAAAFIAAFYGLQAIARAATLVAVVVIASILLVGLALLPQMDTAFFPPTLYDGAGPVAAGALEELPRTMELAVIGMLFPYVKKSMTKSILCWSGLLAVMMAIIQLTVVGCLGDFSEMVMFPYYTAVTAAKVSVLQRMDILATAVWMAALFLKEAFFAMLFMSCMQRLLGGRWNALYALGGGGVALAAGLLLGGSALQVERSVMVLISAVLLGVFAVVVPLFLLAADALKKRRRTNPAPAASS